MKWFKMDTNSVLFGGFENWQLAALLKYKALCAQLESEPSENQLNRILTKKECNFVKSLAEVQQNSVESSIKSLKKRRENDLKRKSKNKDLSKNSAAESANFPYKEEIREDKNIHTSDKSSVCITPAQPKKIKTLVPLDWQPEEVVAEKLKSQGLDAGRVTEKFINSCRAKGLKYLDFNRAILAWDWSKDPSVKAEEEEKCWF